MRITTSRLYLREFEMVDLPAVHQYESDPEVVRYVSYGPYTEEECCKDLAFHVAHQSEQPRTFFHLAIILRSEDHLIGWCGLQITNRQLREAEIGYALHRHYWGKGYMTEAAQAMLEYGFARHNLHRIFGTCHPENHASVRVMQKIGMRMEGHLRENRWSKGAWRDSLLYAILDHEWQKPYHIKTV
ncbi:MAG TPA: GNAT family N-acetyltransferase [Ktedonobacteraceae bacterium]|nr:GNAT family N-acetyltransferase [Ktedonobacteraceae bacterium]